MKLFIMILAVVILGVITAKYLIVNQSNMEDKKLNWYISLDILLALLYILLGALTALNTVPSIKDYKQGKVKYKIDQVIEDGQIISSDTTYVFK